MTLNAEASKRMIAASKQYGIKLTVAHYRRAQPMFLKIKSLLDEKIIGDIRFVQLKMFQPLKSEIIANTEEDWRKNPAISGGGLFHDLAPHQLDLMSYFFGAIKKSVGFAVKQQADTPVDDLVSGQLLFENGIIFNGTWCFTVSKEQQYDICEIYGSKGKISFPMFGNQVNVDVAGQNKEYGFEPLQHVEQPMIKEVVKYFLNEGSNPCSGEEALITMELLDVFTQ